MTLQVEICPTEKILELKNWYDNIPTSQKNSLEFKFDKDSFYTLKVDNELIGIMSVLVNKKKYLDFRRFVIEEYRGCGMAEIMLNYLILHAQQNKIKSLWGIIKTSNEKGTDYLRKKGFKVCKLFKDPNDDTSSAMLKL